ncbi:MAG: DUF177 domain-containing protein [Gammaproteobacteria bacterium]|nr:DUF177 domain-containing protein [Gammaproteobacteria bacterium]
MSSGSDEPVDCERLASERATLEREYPLAGLPRVRDVLADATGTLRARVAFARDGQGRAIATVAIEANPRWRCQRCGLPVERTLASRSVVEFVADERTEVPDGDREPFVAPGGRVRLADLAEEEFLLAAPLAPSCDEPERCARAPRPAPQSVAAAPATRRPFDGLRDLLQKTDRT